MVVVTGISGSGKSSFAFDTLFAEGQRRYLEYLSPHARTLVKQAPKPAIDAAEGLSPTLAIGQGRQGLYARGTIATYTDIYDFLMILYASIGEQHSPATGNRLIRHSRQEIIDILLKKYPNGSRLQILAPIKRQKEKIEETVARLQHMGFIRLQFDEQEWVSENPLPALAHDAQIDVVVDRLEMKEGARDRLSQSIETAMSLSQGVLKVREGKTGPFHYWTEIYVCPETGLSFAPLEPNDFNFNSPRGSCPVCQGQGGQEIVDGNQLLKDPDLPLMEQVDSILDLLPKKTREPIENAWFAFIDARQLPEEKKIKDASPAFLNEALHGSSIPIELKIKVEGESKLVKTTWKGLVPFIQLALQDKKKKGRLNELESVFWQKCPSCKGSRLKPESLACLVQGKNIYQLGEATVSALLKEIDAWRFEGKQGLIAQDLLSHIRVRLQFLEQVGLGYLELNRQGKTLSDGETQRVQLASQIGAKLSGILYVLDEPSLGLHRQDIQHLRHVIQELKALGNTVVLVEHERSLIQQADHILELGPGAGIHGGQLLFQGDYEQLIQDPNSPTGNWLSGRFFFPAPPKRKIKKPIK